MKPQISFLASILLLTACSSGNRPKRVYYVPPPAGVINEFRYLGNALVCVHEDHFEGYDGCLHIGDIWIGQELPEVEGKLGAPYQVLTDNPRGELRVYTLQGSEEILPYLVITIKENRVAAIQLTGDSTLSPYTFSSLALGDAAKNVEEILGKPSSIKPVEEIDGELWGYLPFPISVELKNGKVYSIRISRPGESAEGQ